MSGRVPVRSVRGLTALAAVLAAGLTFGVERSAAAGVRTWSASAGVVTATLSASEVPRGSPTGLSFKGINLEITRSGQIAYLEGALSNFCEPCDLQTFAGAPPPMQLVELERNGEPNVVLQLYSDGAHCCTVVQVLTWDPREKSYVVAERDFGDPGDVIREPAGYPVPVFETADDRFAYRFAPYAYSGLPLAVLAFRDGRFVHVTRSFAAQIATDASRWLKAFRANRRNGLGNGVIAAWAADEELLGHDRLVRATLAREARHGNLRSREHYGPSGRAFVKALLRFLKRTGYRH
jgi:hypothetical protein